MPREDLVEKLVREQFNGKKIKWKISPRRGERMPYAENGKHIFLG